MHDSSHWEDEKAWPVICPCGVTFRKDEGVGGGRYCSQKCWDELGVPRPWMCLKCGTRYQAKYPEACKNCGETTMVAVDRLL